MVERYVASGRPLGISQGIGATIHNDATLTSNIAVFAGDDRAPFDAEDMALLKALMPHLQRASRASIETRNTLLPRSVQVSLKTGRCARAVSIRM